MLFRSLVRRFVEEQPWANMGAGTETESDHQQCLQHLMQFKTQWQDQDAKRYDASVYDLIQDWQLGPPEREQAQRALNLLGLHMTDSGLHVSNRHSGTEKIFKETQFAGRWKHYLKRLPDAIELPFKMCGTEGRVVRVRV